MTAAEYGFSAFADVPSVADATKDNTPLYVVTMDGVTHLKSLMDDAYLGRTAKAASAASADAASKLATARKINGKAFDGTQDINIDSAESMTTTGDIHCGGKLYLSDGSYLYVKA